jgi:hypothetical protein
LDLASLFALLRATVHQLTKSLLATNSKLAKDVPLNIQRYSGVLNLNSGFKNGYILDELQRTN